MPTLHLLGTGSGFSGPERTTTMLAFCDGDQTLLVDCGGDVIRQALAAGIDLETIEGMIVTHEHPDHVGGFPLFIEKIWLSGRRRPIPVYGIRPALDQARRCFDVFDTKSWDGLPERDWREVRHEENAPVLENDRWRVIASPGTHSVPVIGLRVESKTTGKSVAYSCDTTPSDAIARLAEGADILVHEATGVGPGHTSMRQAAEIAVRAQAARLILIHLPPGDLLAGLDEARQIFGNSELGGDLGSYTF